MIEHSIAPDLTRILVAEDDADTAEFICDGLARIGHTTARAPDGAAALAFALEGNFGLILLDRLLPQLDGLSVLRALRASRIGTPVILLTALGRIEDRIEGLEAGADDYLVKPFAFGELAARINALLRRAPTAVTQIEFGTISMDLIKREVRHCRQLIALQPREFRLLEELLRSAGRVVTRTMLMERVWNFHFDPHTNIVETHMSRLRAKLKIAGSEDAIETVRGLGYRMRP